jgi:hypothetical protein
MRFNLRWARVAWAKCIARATRGRCTPAISSNDTFDYDVRRDGQRFLIITQAKAGESQPISVIVNWRARLNK